MENYGPKSAHFPLPEMHFFISGNAFCGSCKKLNYNITPVPSNEDSDQPAHFHVWIWYGDLCSELSESAGEQDFPLDVDGQAHMVEWLEEKLLAMQQE